MSIERYLHKPEEAPTVTEKDIGRGLTFGARCWMPGINISGRSYSIDYENITQDHLAGIPVRKDGVLIGHATMDTSGHATITLLEGMTLTELDEYPTSITTVGMAPECSAVALADIDTRFRKAVGLDKVEE